MISALSKERLEKLATHLESGELIHKRFDFNNINADEVGKPLYHNGCGYAGCAIGELPAVFPEDIGWFKGWPAFVGTERKIGTVEAAEFLGITHTASEHLFMPTYQEPRVYGGKWLSGLATRHEVASNIREFIKRKEAA